MGDYSLEDPDQIMLNAPPKISKKGKKASAGNTSGSLKLPIVPPPPPPSNSPAPGKNQIKRKMTLLDEIKHPPFALKKVTPPKGANKRKQPSTNAETSLEDLLLIAMQQIKNANSNNDGGLANATYREWDD